MNYREIDGDLLQMFADSEIDIVAHQCNCLHTFGSGIAKAIKNSFEAAWFADLETGKGDRGKMGTYSKAAFVGSDGQPDYIVNIYGQYEYGREKGKVYTDYDALKRGLIALNKEFAGQRIGLPLIGCGSAGGDWNIVSKIIQETLTDMDVTVVRYKTEDNGIKENHSEPNPNTGWDEIM